MTHSLVPGRLPLELLAELLDGAETNDPRVLIGPRVGVDAAVLDFGGRLRVASQGILVRRLSRKVGGCGY